MAFELFGRDAVFKVLNFAFFPLLCFDSLELFEQVIRSPDLFVLQVEMDVYSMVKKVNKNYESDQSKTSVEFQLSKGDHK